MVETSRYDAFNIFRLTTFENGFSEIAIGLTYFAKNIKYMQNIIYWMKLRP